MIKRFLFSSAIAVLVSGSISAQSNSGLFPASFDGKHALVNPDYITFPAVDYSDLLQQNEGAYKVAKMIAADITFPGSGVLTVLEDGSSIWRVSVNVEEAKGIGLYYDNFKLPQGVSMFVYNNNKRHVEGPYTIEDNHEQNVFSTDAVQGEVVWLELNIDNGVDIDNIQLHIDKVASYFRGVEELGYFSDDYPEYGTFDAVDDRAFGGSSKCMINANCPEANGYEHAKNAVVKLVIPAGAGVGFCTGTLVNNTGNAVGDCTKYLLTATHCEGTNATGSDPSFAQWLLKFNYQAPTCDRPATAPTSQRVTGVDFVARDPYDDGAPASDLDADFMLMKVTRLIPSGFNATMIGWNRNPAHQRAYVGDRKFVFFHHPGGDIKKFSSGRIITETNEYYWRADFTVGYGAPGSSGSSMFNNDQQTMGIASVAPYGFGATDTCLESVSGLGGAENTSNRVFYTRLDYAWDNPSLSSPTNAQKLSPWLDPAGTGTLSFNSVVTANNCTPITTSVQKLETSFDGDFNIYPNPSTDGMFQLNIKMNQPAAANLQVVDVTGRPVFNTHVEKMQSQIVNLNLSGLANGMYLVKISNEYGQITKKVVINK